MLCSYTSLSVRVVQLVVPALISTMTSHASLESYQFQTLGHNNVRSTRDTCLTLQVVAERRTPSCRDSELEARVKPRTLEPGEQLER